MADYSQEYQVNGQMVPKKQSNVKGNNCKDQPLANQFCEFSVFFYDFCNV